MKRAFTLIEVLVVVAIIGILAALLFPVFNRAKAAARQAHCISNLGQIGKGIAFYMVDYDGIWPHALDASDKFASQIWNGSPEWQIRIAEMPMMHEAVQPYIKNKEVFQCPSDTGSQVLDNHLFVPFASSPSMHKTYGSSYFYRTEIGFRWLSDASFELPSGVNVMFDGAGHWHGNAAAIGLNDSFDLAGEKLGKYRYNILFGDFHGKNRSYFELQAAWNVPL